MPVQIQAVVITHIEVAPRHFLLKMKAPSIASESRAGQFVHVLPRESPGSDPLLRRAFSIMSIQGNEIDILYRVEGRGTARLSHLREGEFADVIGPLGNGFTPLPLSPERAILVGGGVGVPPMAMLASTRTVQNSLTAIIGARSVAEVICREDFAKYDVPVRIATDDGSLGHHGYVTDLLTAELNADSHAVVYACGPLAMLRAVAKICDSFGVKCQISLEENMPCGVGVCNGCVVAVNGAGDEYGRYRRICVDGPVLWAHEVDWESLEGGAC